MHKSHVTVKFLVKAYVSREYYDDPAQQALLERHLEQDIFCKLQNICSRTEKRRRDSAERIRCLIDAGITFDQIVFLLQILKLTISTLINFY